MNDERLGKVRLDLSVYPGEDLYSDGDVEERLLALAKSNTDFESLLLNENDWSILYHFSPIRENILEWYDFDPEGSVLEIGSGCGAITGLLCRRLKSVTAVDLSKRRSTINALRNNYDNLTIRVGNFEDIDFKEKYNYVTLIGVFEYSINYIHTKDPFGDMLKKAKSLLKKKGVLFIAIENKYGLKYFAGAPEDHEGRLFESIEDYPVAKNVRTFSRRALEIKLTEAGFISDFYYPYPDYKMPRVIYSDDWLPKEGDFNEITPAYDRDRYGLFSESKAFDGLIKDGYFQDFSNSFLVVAKNNE